LDFVLCLPLKERKITMAFKAMFILATALAVAMALPAPEDEVAEVANVEVIPVQQAQDRVDSVASADESGWGWQPAQPAQQAWSAPSKGWGWPKFKYLKFTIPIPILPRIKFGIKGGLKLNAAIQHPKGWGWSR